MALKDWKKLKMKHGYEYAWENKNEDEWEIGVNKNIVYILEPIDSPTRFSKWKKKQLKTKSQALKYAKDYMSKH